MLSNASCITQPFFVALGPDEWDATALSDTAGPLVFDCVHFCSFLIVFNQGLPLTGSFLFDLKYLYPIAD
jgi:hypothetical protein